MRKNILLTIITVCIMFGLCGVRAEASAVNGSDNSMNNGAEDFFNGAGGNAGGDNFGGGSGSLTFEDGVSEYASGWILYVVDENGNNISDTRLWYSYDMPQAHQLSGTGSKAPVIDIKTRMGLLDTSLLSNYRTNAPWGPPLSTVSSGAGRGTDVKNWFLTDDNLENTLTLLWGEPFAKEFATNEYYLILEPIYWLQMHVENSDGTYTATGIYGYGTARGFAEIMKSYPDIFGTSGCKAFKRYTNNYYPNSCKFEFSQFGIQAPSKGGALTHDEIIASGYGIMSVWAGEIGMTPSVPPSTDTPPTYHTANIKFDAKTYNYSDEFDLNKNLTPNKGRIPSGESVTNGIETDAWKIDFDKEYHSASKDVPVHFSLRIETQATNSYRVQYNTANLNKYKVLYPSATFTNQYGYLCMNGEFVMEDKTYSVYSSDSYSTTVHKSCEYYTVENGQIDMWDFERAEISNECFKTTVKHQESKDTPQLTYKRGRGIYSYPQNDVWYSSEINCTSREDGINKANAMANGLVSNYAYEGDTVKVNGVTFLNNGNLIKEPKIYTYPKVTTINNKDLPEIEVEIPFYVKNGFYYTEASYYYRHYTNYTSSANGSYSVYKMSKDTKIENRIHQNYVQNEPIFVHTPVVSAIKIKNSETQTQLVNSRINSEFVDHQLILEHTYSFEFDRQMHLDLKGYGSGDFSKYVGAFQVSFPFDVAIVRNKTGTDTYSYYKANEWIDFSKEEYMSEITFYIPPYAQETDYGEIIVRVFANNRSEGDLSEEENANLIETNYVAYYKTAVQLSGIIYNFQVVGTSDRNLTDGDYSSLDNNNGGYSGMSPTTGSYPYCIFKSERKYGNLNRLGSTWQRYTLDDTITNAWNPKYVLPYSTYKGRAEWCTPVQGTVFYFSVETIANLWGMNDTIEIKPTFRYVAPDGTESEVVVYTSAGECENSEELFHYRELGDPDEQRWDYALSYRLGGNAFKGSYTEEQVAYTMQKYNEATGSNYIYTSNYLRDIPSTYTTDIKDSCASKVILTPNMRLLTGSIEEMAKNIAREGDAMIDLDEDTDTPLDDETKDRFNYSMQTWFGSYQLRNCSQLHFVKKSDLEAIGDLDGNGEVNIWDLCQTTETGTIKPYGNEDIFLKEGFIIMGFEFITYQNGVEHLTYNGGMLDMCAVEGQNIGGTEYACGINPDTMSNPNQTPFVVQSGDVAIFDLDPITDHRSQVGIMLIN